MATKYELATELRALTRGMKPLPICKMKKHELEAEIDRIKALKDMKDGMAEYPPAKPGPLGPRKIEAAEKPEEDTTITVPVMPKKRVVSKPVAVPVRHDKKVVVSFDDTHVDEKPTPVKSLPTKSLFSHPGAPLPSDRPVHKCNCPRCPDNGSA